ncbi:transcriptional regulator [Candidatus Bipolaricaulota bacterium]|nr:transcriptional regulator [Candidatus Bipolaricaulota bacterium]
MPNKQLNKQIDDKGSKITPKQPCEVAIWHILPCIRACLARELVNMDLTQQKAADLLGITQAAVSQYVGEKRGNIRSRDNQTYHMVLELAEDLVAGEVKDISKRICKICKRIQHNPDVLQSCGVPESQADRINIC